MSKLFWAGALTLAVALAARAESPSPATQPDKAWVNPNPARYMFEDQIKPGMKGHGLTVMRGHKIERFKVEVIDIIRGLAPGQNGILVRCSGLNLEHSGIIAGMSGSPVYIDGKMIGAIAFGWGLAKDPIAGIQPIRQMLNIPLNENAKPDAVAQGGSEATLRLTQQHPMWRALGQNLARRSGVSLEAPAAPKPAVAKPALTRLATPLMVSGASENLIKELQTQFADTGLVPVAAGVAADGSGRALGGLTDLKPNDIKLEPGSAISVPIVTGDLDLSAVGTVTEVVDKKVYAFGHQFFADGDVQLPMSTAYIYTIMPNLAQSFKMGANFASQGTLRVDETTGILGVVGDAPKLAPLTMKVTSTDGAVNRTYNYQFAAHPRLTPFILNGVFGQTLMAQRAMPKNFTVTIDGEATFGQRRLKLAGVGTNTAMGGVNVVMPVVMLLDNPYENLKLTGLTLNAKIEPTNRGAQLKNVSINRLIAAPGDELVVTATIERFQKAPEDVIVKLKVPADAVEGTYMLNVGGATSTMFADQLSSPHRYDPQDIDSLIKTIERVMAFEQTKLYARLTMDLRGAAKAGREIKNLPPSRVALLASSKRGDTAPVTAYTQTSIDVNSVLDFGGETFSITVDRRANELHRDAFGQGMGPMPIRPNRPANRPQMPNRGPGNDPHDDPMPPDGDH